MVQINPGDLPDLPVEQLAQFLLGCAREDPTLLARTNSGPVVRRDAEIRVPLGKPIDLAAAQDDGCASPSDETPAPVVRVAGRVGTSPQPFGGAARPLGATARTIDLTARPIVPATKDIRASARPIVPSTREIEESARPIVPRRIGSSGRPNVPSPQEIAALGATIGQAGRATEALNGPVIPSALEIGDARRPIVPSAREIAASAWRLDTTRTFLSDPAGCAGKPVERLAVPADPSAPPMALTARQNDALAGANDTLARPLTGAIDVHAGLVNGLPEPIDATARLVAQKLQLRRPEGRDDPELEELVSIAVACARRAEDAVQQAREISWMARRRMSVFASVAGAGVLAAAAVGVVDRYISEPAPMTASAFVAGPPDSPLGNMARADAVPAPIGGQLSAPLTLAERPPGKDPARPAPEMPPSAGTPNPAPLAVAAAEPVPPARPAPAASPAAAISPGAPRSPAVPARPAAVASPPATVSPPAAAPLAVAAAEPARPAPAAVSPPAAPPPVSVASAVPNPVSLGSGTSAPVAESAPVSPTTSPPVTGSAAPARSAQSTVAAAAEPPVKVAESAPRAQAVAEARSPAPSAHLASPSVAPPGGQNGNPAGTPGGRITVASAAAAEPAPVGPTGAAGSLDAPPTQAAPPVSHPVRHVVRRPPAAARRVVYYPSGPGVLLAQVVYGVRRNLYEIFH